MSDPLKPGDVVLHRAGGPKLTVESVDGEDVTVTWAENGEKKTRTFKAETLLRPIARRT